MPPIPADRSQDAPLSIVEFNHAVSKMPNNKAVGPDGVPAEVFKYCKGARDALFQVIKRIWDEERLPEGFACANFVMLFKNKGSPDDPSKYRCLGMLNHSYKVLSQCMLARMQKETMGFLPDWQAGFRSERGCRDNILILRTIYDALLQRGEKLFVTFIDYSAAFDSVSHKFIDVTLAKAGASMPMVTAILAISWTTISAVTEFTTVWMVESTRVNGNRIRSMVLEKNRCQTAHLTKASTNTI